MIIQKNVADILKQLQIERGLSLAEFAEEIGISKSSLQEYRAAKRNLRADTLELLADKLDIPIASLVTGKLFSNPTLDTLTDLCRNLHPKFQPAAFQQLRALEELFHLSDEAYAMELHETCADPYTLHAAKDRPETYDPLPRE